MQMLSEQSESLQKQMTARDTVLEELRCELTEVGEQKDLVEKRDLHHVS